MYNTIEVIFLDIKSAEIKYFKKDGFVSAHNDNLQHRKVLPYLSIVQSVEGSYDIALGSAATMQTGEGGFFVAPSEIQQTIVHHTNKKSGKMTCRWLFIDVEINKAYRLDMLYRFPTVLDGYFKEKMNDLFDHLFSTDDFWENYSCCYKILGLLLQSSEFQQNKINQGIQNSVEYMMKNYTQTINVIDLAKIANMSESNFYAVFKKSFGCSPVSYLNHYRMSLATDLLIETNFTVSEIGYKVGIKDPLYFSKLFKKAYAISPKEYRTLHLTKHC